jgi:hypothetical protein
LDIFLLCKYDELLYNMFVEKEVEK